MPKNILLAVNSPLKKSLPMGKFLISKRLLEKLEQMIPFLEEECESRIEVEHVERTSHQAGFRNHVLVK